MHQTCAEAFSCACHSLSIYTGFLPSWKVCRRSNSAESSSRSLLNWIHTLANLLCNRGSLALLGISEKLARESDSNLTQSLRQCLPRPTTATQYETLFPRLSCC